MTKKMLCLGMQGEDALTFVSRVRGVVYVKDYIMAKLIKPWVSI